MNKLTTIIVAAVCIAMTASGVAFGSSRSAPHHRTAVASSSLEIIRSGAVNFLPGDGVKGGIALCPESYVPVGGGYDTLDDHIFEAATIETDRPVGNGWEVIVLNNSNSGNGRFRVYVACLRAD